MTIETKKLRKVFGLIEAVKGVSFRVGQGEVLGFLGPNGAGKSTVMRMLTCFLTPTSGTATVDGHDILTDSMEARRLIGYLPESNPLYSDMTPMSFLRFIGEMRGLKGSALAKRIDSAIEICWLGDVRYQIIETLSKGYRRRVGLAQALLHDPSVLILDEPTDGLDPNQKHEVRGLIRDMASKKTTIISTHLLEEVEAICTRAIIIARGRIVADGTPTDLKQRSRYHGAVRLKVETDGRSVDENLLRALPGVESVEFSGVEGEKVALVTVFPQKGKNVAHEVALLAREQKWRIEEIGVEAGRLDEVFRDITTREEKRS
ncbi:ATP-binding cassette domain-containing protein [Candidatus Sumerlaeota bacterium]|nr:ATP-binding cassette domain-containing protein [Candidatus Sumerlaeota bacterium]